MNRRSMLALSGKTIGGFALASPLVLLPPGCNAKNLSVYVQTVVGALNELKPLLPSAAELIVKAIKIAEDFDAAYRAGKFDNAVALFTNLADVLSQITADAGVNNSTVKVALLVAGIAMRAIAVLLKSQADQPGVTEAVSARPSAAAKRQISLIEKLADDVAIDRLFLAVKP